MKTSRLFQIKGFHYVAVIEEGDHCIIEAKSPFSGETNQITLDKTFVDICARLKTWLTTGALIQNVFPDLNADEREFLMTGITKEEWDRYLIPADHEDGNQIEVGA